MGTLFSKVLVENSPESRERMVLVVSRYTVGQKCFSWNRIWNAGYQPLSWSLVFLVLANKAVHHIKSTHIVSRKHCHLDRQDTKENTREVFLGYYHGSASTNSAEMQGHWLAADGSHCKCTHQCAWFRILGACPLYGGNWLRAFITLLALFMFTRLNSHIGFQSFSALHHDWQEAVKPCGVG